MSVAQKGTPDFTDADIDRLLGHAVAPSQSPDLVNRIVAAAARESQIGARLRRSDSRRRVFGRAAQRVAIVVAAVAATAAAAALTAVKGNVRRLPELPGMIFHLRHRLTPMAHPPALIAADDKPRLLSPALQVSGPLPSAVQVPQNAGHSAVPPVQHGGKPDEAQWSFRPRTRHSVATAHIAHEEIQVRPRVIDQDHSRATEEPHAGLADPRDARSPGPADRHEAVQTDRTDRETAAPDPARTVAPDDRTAAPKRDEANDPKSRPGNGDKKPKLGPRARGWRRPFGRWGRF